MGNLHSHLFTFTREFIEPTPNESAERIYRENRGQCGTCGIQTHDLKQGLFFVGAVRIPLTNDTVLRGRCLVCNPLTPNTCNDIIIDPDEPFPVAVIEPDNIPPRPEHKVKVFAGLAAVAVVLAVLVGAVFIILHTPDPKTTTTTTTSSTTSSSTTSTTTTTTTTTTTATTSNEVATTTVPPYEPQKVQEVIEANVLSRGVKFDDLSLKDSRNLALDWLLNIDQMKVNFDDSSLSQRFILALLAFEFGTSIFRTSTNWLSNENECSWEGITCNEDDEVSEMELSKSYAIYYLSWH